MSSSQPVCVVTDSTACLPADWRAQWDIRVIPLTVAFGQEVFRDGIDLTTAEFYRRLLGGDILPVTSQPSVGAFEAVYAPLVAAGRSIVSIHLSSGVSGTVGSAQSAAAEFPGADIRVVDSRTVSMGFGWAVRAAAEAAAAGADADAVEQAAQDVLARSRILIALDTLDYLHKGGRIGKAACLMGALLAVKPIITVEGPVTPIEKPRTRRLALQRLAAMVRQAAPLDDLCLIYTHDPSLAEQLGEQLAGLVDPDRVVMVDAGPVLGTYGGPGAAAVAYVQRRSA